MADRQDLLVMRLAEVFTGMADGAPIEALLQRSADSARALLACPVAGIWRYDGAARSLDLATAAPEVDGTPVARLQVAGEVAELRVPALLAGDAWPESEPLAGASFAAGLRSPLIWHGELWGVLYAADDAPGRVFTPSDAQVAELLARQAAAVVGYAQLLASHEQLDQSLVAEQERLLHIQIAIRQVLEEPDMKGNLTEVVQALQALGWRRVVLALFDEEAHTKLLVTAGMSPDEEESFREHVVPAGIWDLFSAGALEQHRLSGVYFVPHGDSEQNAWTAADIVFAPLHVGQERIAGVIRVDDPVDGLRPSWEALRPLDILAGQTAYIVENARLLTAAAQSAEVLAEQVDELSMMHRADRELSSHLNVDRIMRLTMDWALRRTGAETGILMLMTDDKRGLVPSITLGYVDRELFSFDEHTPLPVSRGIMGRAARTTKTQNVRDVMADRDYLPFMPGERSHLSVPLLMRGEVLGVITVASTRVDAFAERDVSFLERLARRAAVALDNARLFRQSEQLADDMAVLYTASRAITSTLERDTILQRIAQAITVTLESSSAVIFDYRPEAQELQVLAVYRLGTVHNAVEILPPVKHVVPLVTYPAFETAVEEQHPLALRANDPAISHLDRVHMLEDHIQTMLLVPLVAQEELIGLVAVIEGRYDRIFSSNDVYKAETLASQASVALRQSQLYSEVLELEKLKSEMIRMASHDLRNPLNNIMGYLELLAMTLDDQGMTPDQEMYLDTLRRSTQTMRALLEDLLTLERIESERQSEWEQFDLGGLVVEVVEAQRASADFKHQTLSVERATPAPAVQGSVTQIRQAVANLVGNAIKYTPEDGHIQVRFKTGKDRLIVEVEDDGYGISPERQARIFERFYRAREPGTDHIGGTGLGLSLVKTVIERHGGQVWFTSEPGHGSVFGFWLPPTQNGSQVANGTGHDEHF